MELITHLTRSIGELYALVLGADGRLGRGVGGVEWPGRRVDGRGRWPFATHSLCRASFVVGVVAYERVSFRIRVMFFAACQRGSGTWTPISLITALGMPSLRAKLFAQRSASYTKLV